MNDYYIGDRGYAPVALRLFVYGQDPDLPFCQTILPLRNEPMPAYCARVHAGARVWHQIRININTQTHCVYELPADPHAWDERWMRREQLDRIVADHRNSASVRLSAIRELNRMQRLVPCAA